MSAKQCPSCGGDCGRTTHCNYAPRLTAQELDAVKAIVAKWDYATEAAIEAYLLGKSCTGVTQHDVRAHVRADIDKLKAALRCGAPSTETWHELASRTNAERSEAANRIEELERKLAFTEEMNGIASNLMRNCIECINDQERKLAEAERRQVPTEAMRRAVYMALHYHMNVQNPNEWHAADEVIAAMFTSMAAMFKPVAAAPEQPK